MNLDLLAAELKAAAPSRPVIPELVCSACAGLPIAPADVWTALESDQSAVAAGEVSAETLRAFVVALLTTSARQSGTRPAHYLQAATCAHCGDVWLWDGVPARVLGCPWCHQRQDHDFGGGW